MLKRIPMKGVLNGLYKSEDPWCSKCVYLDGTTLYGYFVVPKSHICLNGWYRKPLKQCWQGTGFKNFKELKKFVTKQSEV